MDRETSLSIKNCYQHVCQLIWPKSSECLLEGLFQVIFSDWLPWQRRNSFGTDILYFTPHISFLLNIMGFKKYFKILRILIIAPISCTLSMFTCFQLCTLVKLIICPAVFCPISSEKHRSILKFVPFLNQSPSENLKLKLKNWV